MVGDRLNLEGVINKTNLSKIELFKIIKQSKFALNSGENSLSLFMLDCLSNGTKVFVNIKSKSKILKKNKNIIPVNFDNPKNFFNKVKENIIKNTPKIFNSNKLLIEKNVLMTTKKTISSKYLSSN